MKLSTFLSALPVIGPLARVVPEVKSFVADALAAMHPADQATAKAELDRLIAENDAGHARLQDKLRNAAKR